MVLRHNPKNSENVMTPKMFMSTAAAATLSGNMLRATLSRASNGVCWGLLGISAAAGPGAYIKPVKQSMNRPMTALTPDKVVIQGCQESNKWIVQM